MPFAGGANRNQESSGWLNAARRWVREPEAITRPDEPVLGLALAGGFARGIAHVGVLRVFEREGIPIKLISGVSSGAIIAAAFASGVGSQEIEEFGRSVRLKDIVRWKVNRLGLASSERLEALLGKLLKVRTFQEMKIPLVVVATDLNSGKPVVFRNHGDVMLPIRASCSYPGLFLPVLDNGRYLVDGAMSMGVPALPLRRMGASHIVSVCLPATAEFGAPQNMFRVVHRCFQIMQGRTEREWRRLSNIVLAPDCSEVSWDGLSSAAELIAAGEKAAQAAVPWIRHWLKRPANSLGATASVVHETKKPVIFLQSPA